MRQILIALAGGALVVTLAVPAGASTAEPQRGGARGHGGSGPSWQNAWQEGAAAAIGGWKAGAAAGLKGSQEGAAAAIGGWKAGASALQNVWHQEAPALPAGLIQR